MHIVDRYHAIQSSSSHIRVSFFLWLILMKCIQLSCSSFHYHRNNSLFQRKITDHLLKQTQSNLTSNIDNASLSTNKTVTTKTLAGKGIHLNLLRIDFQIFLILF